MQEDPQSLAQAIRKMVEMGVEGRKQLGRAARERVRERFELGSVVMKYERVYEEEVEKIRS